MRIIPPSGYAIFHFYRRNYDDKNSSFAPASPLMGGYKVIFKLILSPKNPVFAQKPLYFAYLP